MEGVGYNKPAAERSWRHMRIFFDDVLGPTGKCPANRGRYAFAGLAAAAARGERFSSGSIASTSA